jgi:hypothetical protein
MGPCRWGERERERERGRAAVEAKIKKSKNQIATEPQRHRDTLLGLASIAESGGQMLGAWPRRHESVRVR